ncbi:MAG: 2-hydroxyacyl-CoA dehydratase [Candidatus Omnitrophica bacterium]|nr:2-hydroxyacyl-CoA dehydratase [Candidatus Omnitrophota bacterium]
MEIGFTSTIPVELIFAAGHEPVDLNNVFITDSASRSFITRAEAEGFPGAFCSWVKGIYGVVKHAGLKRLIVVVEGDCSNNQKLAEIFHNEGIEVFCFGYPHAHSYDALQAEIERLKTWLVVDETALRSTQAALDRVRSKLAYLDVISYKDLKVTGFENHLWLVSATDFNGDHVKYDAALDDFIANIRKRKSADKSKVRLGYIGVPPIVDDIYQFIELKGGLVVFNEVQRQFAMLDPADDLVQRYLNYTYPYGIENRIADITRAVKERKLDGLIHYVQAFCSHTVDDMVLRERFGIPMLTVECDMPGHLDGKNRTKIEAFLERWL